MPSPDVQQPAEIATPHDLLFTGSALGVASGIMPDTSWGRFGLNLARRPGVVAERVGWFGRELASIATGTSDRAPAKPDKRFSDPAWQGNPLMKRSMQARSSSGGTPPGYPRAPTIAGCGAATSPRAR